MVCLFERTGCSLAQCWTGEQARAGRPCRGWQGQGQSKAHRWWMKELRQVKIRRGTMAQRVMKLSNTDCR